MWRRCIQEPWDRFLFGVLVEFPNYGALILFPETQLPTRRTVEIPESAKLEISAVKKEDEYQTADVSYNY